VGFLLAKGCLNKHPKLQSDKNNAIDSSIPIYEQVEFHNHIIMDQNSIELKNNAAYGPIQLNIN
jgi:hypothetical protein